MGCVEHGITVSNIGIRYKVFSITFKFITPKQDSENQLYHNIPQDIL